MRLHEQFVTCLLVQSLAFLGSSADAGGSLQQGVSETVRKTLARRESLFSGRFDFQQEWGYYHRGKKKIALGGAYRYSLSGVSWSRWFRNDNGELVHPAVNYDGKLMDFGSTPQNDGSTRHSLHLHDAKTGSASFVKQGTEHTRFIYAGTIWHGVPAEYIKNHIGDAQHVKDVEIRGVRTMVLEWQSARDEIVAKAFHAVYSKAIAEGEHATLRLYVAPSLGYLVPRYEYIGPDGTLLCRCDSKGYREVAPAIYFPKTSTLQMYDPEPNYFAEFDFTNIEFVNDVVPEDDFHFKIPNGTNVSDGRTGKQKSFVVGESVSAKDLDDWYEENVARASRLEGHSGYLGRIVVINVICVVLVATILVFRRFRSKSD